ncbi:MAG: DUF393 domain-containing protein [Pedobacter sp.]|nr:MAG: DUF393 domain-containing protein [Pedobacter sp.]
METEKTIIFFDGICNLCHGAVQFTIARDTRKHFHFSSLQSDFAGEKLKSFNIGPQESDSFLLLENGRVYDRSTAALRVAKRLKGLWPLLYAFIVVPKFIRDGVYNFIARNRYRWYGKQDNCWLPSPELKKRFL